MCAHTRAQLMPTAYHISECNLVSTYNGRSRPMGVWASERAKWELRGIEEDKESEETVSVRGMLSCAFVQHDRQYYKAYHANGPNIIVSEQTNTRRTHKPYRPIQTGTIFAKNNNATQQNHRERERDLTFCYISHPYTHPCTLNSEHI